MEPKKANQKDKVSKKDAEPSKEVKETKGSKGSKCMGGTKLWQAIAVVMVIIAIGAIMIAAGTKCQASKPTVTNDCSLCGTTTVSGAVSKDSAANKTLSFINKYLLSGQGVSAELEGIEDENGVYAVNVSVQGQASMVYTSKDGKMLFLQGLDFEKTAAEIDAQTAAEEEEPAAPQVTKSDKPVAEVFVMSYCPYGTQIEKGILPVMETLGDKADIQIKFVDYAMHGEKEVTENLRQYCIQKDTPEKFEAYLSCFLEAGDSAGCLTTAGVSETALKTCMDATDEEYKITELLNDQASWGGSFPPFNVHTAENQQYGVSGSPTLVINGAKVSSGRDAKSLLNTICAAFNTPPAECATDLSSEGSPSPGFGYTPGSGSTTAQC